MLLASHLHATFEFVSEYSLVNEKFHLASTVHINYYIAPTVHINYYMYILATVNYM